MKHILFLIVLISFWSCESKPKPIESIQTPVAEKPAIVEDSIFYSYGENIDPIWQSDFDSAVAVILDGSHYIMYDVSKMDKKYAPSSKRTLNAVQLKRMMENLSGEKQSAYTPSDCFSPYHGFFFYKKSKIKARLALCFSCGTYFTLPRNSGGIDYKITKHVFKEVGLPIYNWDDSTEILNAKIKYSDYF